MDHVQEYRDGIQICLQADVADWSENWEMYTRLCPLKEIESERDEAVSKLQDSLHTSNATYVNGLIDTILDAWSPGTKRFFEFFYIARMIVCLVKIIPTHKRPLPNADTMARWIYANSHELCAPDSKQMLFQHLQYMCNEFMKDDVLFSYLTLHGDRSMASAPPKRVWKRKTCDIYGGL